MTDNRLLEITNILALKIVVAGVRGCGQSTFVSTLSDLLPEVPPSPDTIAMDFGRIQIDSDSVLYLFGMPGGRRYDFMWEVLNDGLLGCIVLLDSKRPAHFRESKSILETMGAYSPTPFVVAANFQDWPDAWSVADLRIALRISPEIGVVPCVATERESVKQVILALLEKVIEATDARDELEMNPIRNA